MDNCYQSNTALEREGIDEDEYDGRTDLTVVIVIYRSIVVHLKLRYRDTFISFADFLDI